MRKLYTIAFWGGLWGLTEATLGHFLHLFAFPIGWLVWYPMAFGFMWTVYQQTGQPYSVLVTALVAASVKFADLFMPIPVIYVVNPAVSILLEGLAVFLVFRALALQPREKLAGVGPLLLTNVIWRAFFILYLLALPSGFVKASQLSGTLPFLQFLLFESAVNGLIMYGTLRFFPKHQAEVAPGRFSPHPLVALGMLGIAFVIQLKF